MLNKLCGNYVQETELLIVSGAPAIMRIPIRRCLLAERMLNQIVQTERGRGVATKLTIALTNTFGIPPLTNTEAAEIRSLRAALGPDLEPIHHAECQGSRCLHSCTPGYNFMLEEFGPPRNAEAELGRGCLESTE